MFWILYIPAFYNANSAHSIQLNMQKEIDIMEIITDIAVLDDDKMFKIQIKSIISDQMIN